MRKMEAVEPSEHEMLIVGAGPAGLSAALVFGRALVDTVLIDAGKPRAAVTASTHGFLSRDGVPRAELEDAGGFVATAGAETVLPLAERLAGRERVYFAGDVELGFAGIAESAGDGYRVAKSIVKEIAKERWERA